MDKIGSFFDKFRNKFAGQVQNYAVIIEIIKKYTGIEIEMKDISISSGVLRLKASQSFKNEIYIKKTQILKEINNKTNNLTISDIA